MITSSPPAGKANSTLPLKNSSFTARKKRELTYAFSRQSRVDPAAEFTRIRQSLTLLESHIFTIGSSGRAQQGYGSQIPVSNTVASKASASQSYASGSSPHRSNGIVKDTRSISPDSSETRTGNVPGLLGQSDQGGFYAGPTSTLSHLLSVGSMASIKGLYLIVVLGIYTRGWARRSSPIDRQPWLFSSII